MQAVVKDKPVPGSLAVVDVNKPKLEKDCLIAKVDAVGICGTDLHICNWETNYQNRIGDRLPVVIGHEFCGVITEMDGESNDFKVGDRIVAAPGISCGECYYCNTGAEEICSNRKCTGIELDGAMAEYVQIKKKNCFYIPPEFPVDIAATLEPMSIAYNAFAKAGRMMGQNVVVIGPGAIGYFVCLFAYLSGASSISIMGLPKDEERLRIFSANIPGIKIYTDNGKEFMANNYLADTVFELSGVAAGINVALACTKKRAQIIEIGIPSRTTDINLVDLVRKELVLKGTHAMSLKLWREMVSLMVSLPDEMLQRFAAAVTHKYPLQDVEEAFAAARELKGLKVLLYPGK